MVKYILVILFSIFCLSSIAQQGPVMDFGEIDSTEIEMQRNLEYHQLINGTFGEQNLTREIMFSLLSERSFENFAQKTDSEQVFIMELINAGPGGVPKDGDSEQLVQAILDGVSVQVQGMILKVLIKR